jgi:hypothetical protein
MSTKKAQERYTRKETPMSAKTQTAKATVKGQPETDYNGNTIYSVPSRTQACVTYQVVERADGHPVCCCTAARYGRHCCHIAAVNEYKWRMAARMRDSAPVHRDNRPFSLFKAS